MTDLWVEATHDFDREENDRQLIAAREAVVDLWQFLASAVNTDDFENRKALISDRLDQAAQGETRQRLEAALDRDFEVVLSQRPKGRKAAYDEFGDWSYEDAQAVITKLKAVDGYDEPAILAALQGIGYDTFQVLDEKPGYFGNYYDEDWHWKLRRARNSAEGFFDAIGPRTSKTAGAPTIMPRDMSDYDAAPQAEKDAYQNWVSQGAADSDSGWYVPLNFSSWRRSYWDDTKGDTTYAPGMPPMAGSRKQADGFFGTTCEKCGFTPKNSRDVFYDAMSQQTMCVNGAACIKRREKQQEKQGSRKQADAAFEPNNPEFMAGFRAGSADARTQPTVNSPGTGMVPYGSSIPEGASDKFRKGYASGYQSATDVHMGSRKTAGQKLIRVDGQEYVIVKEVDDGIVVAEYSVLMPRTPQLLLMPADTEYEVIGESMVPIASRRTAEKYRADVAGINEDTWSNNALEFDTIEEAQAYLSDLSMRWFGYDMGRVVPVSTPRNEVVDPSGDIYQNFRSGSRHRRVALKKGDRVSYGDDSTGTVTGVVGQMGGNAYYVTWDGQGFEDGPYQQDELKTASRKRAWTEDGSDITDGAAMLMNLQADAYDALGIQGYRGSEEQKNADKAAVVQWIVKNLAGHAGGITEADMLIAEDYNAHSAVEAWYIVKGGSRKTAADVGDTECTNCGTFFDQAEVKARDNIPGGATTEFCTQNCYDEYYGPDLTVLDVYEGRRKTAFSPTHQCFDPSSPTGFVQCELVEGDPRGPEGTFVTVRREDGSTTSELGEMVIPLKEGSRRSARRLPFEGRRGRRVGIGGPDAGDPIGSYDDTSEGRGDLVFPCIRCGDPVWPALQWAQGYVHKDGQSRDHKAFPARQASRKTAAAILDEDPENNTMTTAQGVWTMEYDSESMKRMKEADDYEPWYPDFQEQAGWSQPHHYKLTGPNGQVHEFSAQGDSVAGPWYSAWEQARSIVSRASRTTAGNTDFYADFTPITDDPCPTCHGPTQVWSDNSDGITVNFACDNPGCPAGKGPWDTPRPTTASRKTAGWAGYTLVDESKLSDQYHKRFIGHFQSEAEAKAWAESQYGVPPDVWGDRVYLTSVPGDPEVMVVDGREVPFTGQEMARQHWLSRKTAQAGPPEPWPESACGEQDEDTFCIRDTGHDGDHQFRSRFWIEQKMDDAGLTSIEEELPEEGEEQAEEVPPENGDQPPEKKPEEKSDKPKGEVPPQFKKKTSRPKADLSKVAGEDYRRGFIDGQRGHPMESQEGEYADGYFDGRAAKLGMIKGAPFADYKDFADCVSKNQDADDPDAYCGYIKHKVEDTKESILIASALLPRLSHADFEQATEELGRIVGEKQWA